MAKKKKTQTFIDQFRDLMLTSGLRQCEVERKTGVAKAVLSRFAAGKVGLSNKSLNSIAEVLGLEVTRKNEGK